MASKNELRGKLLWMTAARVATATLLLGWALVAEILAPGPARGHLFALVVVTYALGAVHALIVRSAERASWVVDVQLASDVILITAFVGATGGVTSYASTLYSLPVIAASMLRSRRSALVVSIIASSAYAGLVLAQYLAPGLAPSSWRAGFLPPPNVAVFTVGLNVFGLLAVALLSGSLARRLQRADARLAVASTEIAELHALNQDVIDSLSSGLVTTDYGGRVLTFNRAASAITGLKAPEVIGRHVAEVLQLPDHLAESLDARAEGGGRWPEGIEFHAADGRVLEIGLSSTHVVTPSGRAGLLVNFQDVTEFRRMEREAVARQRLAALGEMAAGIAHEIRNPLASISGSIQVLRGELALDEEQGRLMDIVLRESERLNGVIRTFLAYARPGRPAARRLDLRTILGDTAVLLRNSAEVGAAHSIAVDAPEAEVGYEADEGQIRQIVWNLATNGLRAMPHGGRLLLGTASWGGDEACAGAGVLLVVQDEGVGIASDELDRIFQPFYGNSPRGSGLGLAIVHRIVADYGGEIQITSQLGEGTRVVVRLPFQAAGDTVSANAQALMGQAG